MRSEARVGDGTLPSKNKQVKRKNTGGVPRATNGGKSASPRPELLPPHWFTQPGSIIVPVELPPKAHALLSAMALHQDHSSVGAYLITLAKNEAAAFGKALGEEGETLDGFFAVGRKEVAS